MDRQIAQKFAPGICAICQDQRKAARSQLWTAESEPHLYYVDQNMLRTPPIAVAQLKKEILNMADLAMQNFICSLETICKLDFSK